VSSYCLYESDATGLPLPFRFVDSRRRVVGVGLLVPYVRSSCRTQACRVVTVVVRYEGRASLDRLGAIRHRSKNVALTRPRSGTDERRSLGGP
jgi:hypothetical protein